MWRHHRCGDDNACGQFLTDVVEARVNPVGCLQPVADHDEGFSPVAFSCAGVASLFHVALYLGAEACYCVLNVFLGNVAPRVMQDDVSEAYGSDTQIAVGRVSYFQAGHGAGAEPEGSGYLLAHAYVGRNSENEGGGVAVAVAFRGQHHGGLVAICEGRYSIRLW